MKIRHPPLIPPIKGEKVPSPLVGEGLGEGYFSANTIICAVCEICGSKLVSPFARGQVSV